MNGNNRSDIAIGARTRVVRKKNQRGFAPTEGIIRDILTIKLRQESGVDSRRKEIQDD